MVRAAMLPREALREVEGRLAAALCPDADFDARELFRLAAGRDACLSDRPLSAAEAERLESLCARRCTREPLQYICGSWPFLDFELAVGPGVLCPRADTEAVAEAAARLLAGVSAPRVLDLCAGSGCLGLGVKRFCPDAIVTCLEKSPEAFVYLEKNVHIELGSKAPHSAENTLCPAAAPAEPAAEAVLGDVFDYWRGLPPGGLDMIVSNPPYLTAEEMRALQPEVAREPAMALAAGEDGLDFYRAIARYYKRPLRGGGWLVLEIGCAQRRAAEAILAAEGWANITCQKDFGGNDRCLAAQKPENQTTSCCNI